MILETAKTQTSKNAAVLIEKYFAFEKTFLDFQANLHINKKK